MPVIDVAPEAVERRLAELAEHPFDLSRGPLLRAELLRCSAEDHVLAMCVHHAAFDLWSYEVFMEELGRRYADELRRVAVGARARWGSLRRLRPLAAGLADTGARRAASRRLGRDLAGGPSSLRFGPDSAPVEPGKPRPSGAVEAELSSDTADGVRRYVNETGASLHAVLLAGFAVLLHRLSGSDDLVIGNPYANRSRHDVAQIVGPVSNMLPLRVDLSGEPSFAAVVERAGASAAGGFAHQDLPFELIVHAVNPPRQLDRPPLYSVAFALQNVPRRDWALEGCQVESWNVDPGEAPMDLILFAIDRGPGIELRLVYDRASFDERFAAGLLERFELLLGAGLANPQAAVSTLPMLSDADREPRLERRPGSRTALPA